MSWDRGCSSLGSPPVCCGWGRGDCPTPGWGPAFLSVLSLADYTVNPASEILWATAQTALSMGGSFSSFRSQLTAHLLRSSCPAPPVPRRSHLLSSAVFTSHLKKLLETQSLHISSCNPCMPLNHSFTQRGLKGGKVSGKMFMALS